jgi:hypothetical protein
MIEKDTHSNGSAWATKADIDARCAAAYDANRALFDSVQHQYLVAQVKQVCKKHFASYERLYDNCRPANKKRPAHTEIKFEDVYKGRNWNKVKLAMAADIVQLGIDSDMISINNNLSRGCINVSIHVV